MCACVCGGEKDPLHSLYKLLHRVREVSALAFALLKERERSTVACRVSAEAKRERQRTTSLVF